MPTNNAKPCCPICTSTNVQRTNNAYFNLYSEQISKLLKLTEVELIQQGLPMLCSNCNTHFWSNPLPSSIRSYLYSSLLPAHPKGSDAVSKLFNLNSLLDSLMLYQSDLPRSRRILDGYLRAFQYSSDTLQQDDISLEAITSIPLPEIETRAA